MKNKQNIKQVMLSFRANFAIFTLKAKNTEYLPALKIAVP